MRFLLVALCSASTALALCGQSPCRTGDTVRTVRPVRTVQLLQSGKYAYTQESLDDVIDIDAGVLVSPLSADEQAQIRSIVLDEFKNDPAKIAKVLPQVHRVAEVFRSGAAMDRAFMRESDWELSIKLAPTDPFVARWLALAKRHAPLVAQSDSFVVTQRAIDAFFLSSDCVAALAGQPRSTSESHLAHAERRWLATQFLYGYTDLRATALEEIKQKVHAPADVQPEARTLENAGMQFINTMNTYMSHFAAIGGLSYKGQTTAQGINFATRKFMGQGP
ncbi:MAG TPA: hypothetical protein VNV25_14985 [Gemmatimonadaceae bacterium]|nr:hypothetical protein [Gemmatimonadaceae bacterium]